MNRLRMTFKHQLRRIAHWFDWVTLSERTMFEDEIKRLTDTLVVDRDTLNKALNRMHSLERELEKERMVNNKLMEERRR